MDTKDFRRRANAPCGSPRRETIAADMTSDVEQDTSYEHKKALYRQALKDFAALLAKMDAGPLA